MTNEDLNRILELAGSPAKEDMSESEKARQAAAQATTKTMESDSEFMRRTLDSSNIKKELNESDWDSTRSVNSPMRPSWEQGDDIEASAMSGEFDDPDADADDTYAAYIERMKAGTQESSGESSSESMRRNMDMFDSAIDEERNEYNVGDEIIINGKWHDIVAADNGEYWIADQNGEEYEFTPGSEDRHIPGATYESAKPDFADIDDDGDKEESMKKAAEDKKKKETKEAVKSDTDLMREWANSIDQDYEDRGHVMNQPEGETVDNSLRRYLNADPMKVKVQEDIKTADLLEEYKSFKKG